MDIAVITIFPGTPNVGNNGQIRDHGAELALGGPGEDARNSEAELEMVAVVNLLTPMRCERRVRFSPRPFRENWFPGPR